MKALQIAATGMAAQQMRVETISNNLANMSTTGYNTRRAEFADLHYQQFARAGSITASDGTVLPTGIQLGLGVRPIAVSVELSQGALSATGGDLDVAIEGQGYLEITLPSGQTAYTRDGALKRSAEGLIVTSDGFPVSPEIVIPSDARSISINGAGEVHAYFAEAPEGQLIGQISLAGFKMRRAWRPSARTSSRRPKPQARPCCLLRGKTGWAFCGKAILKTVPSIPCARSRS